MLNDVKRRILITPPNTASIVESITRNTLLEISKTFNLSTEIRTVNKSELYTSDEIFFFGTSVEIIPLVSIDNKIIGNGVIGSYTKIIQRIFKCCNRFKTRLAYFSLERLNVLKRTFDIILSIIAIFISSPFMILIAILIKITSKGPVFF